MRAVHTRVWRLRGVSSRLGSDPCHLIGGLGHGLLVAVSADPTTYADLAWRRVSLANVILNRVFGGGQSGPGGEVEERLTEELEQEVARVRREFGSGPYLVFRREAEVADFECVDVVSRESFDVGFDCRPPKSREGSRVPIERLLVSLCLEVPECSGTDEVLDTIFYLREDGRPLFTFRLESKATGEVGRVVSPESWAGIATAVHSLEDVADLQTVFRLLRSSLHNHGDRLRAFLGAWFGLEVLVGKLYPRYRRPEGGDTQPLAERFSVVAQALAPEDADTDVSLFRRSKRSRDELLHGRDVPEGELPLRDARALLRKYLRLHTREGVGTPPPAGL